MPWPTDLKYSEIDGTLNHDSSEIIRASRDNFVEILKHQANFEWGGYRLYDGSHTHIHQNPTELADFIFHLIEYEQTSASPLNKLLMVGFLDGATDSILNKVFCFEEIVAIDTFQEGGNGDFLRANLKFKNLTLICGDSTLERVQNKANMLGPYDLIFIDANHAYEFVRKDFENAVTMISPHGIIAMHDIFAPSAPGVGKFWKELEASEKYQLCSFYNGDVAMKTGIGVVRVK
mgnify:CR=1 FL=1